MKTIWKYELDLKDGAQQVESPVPGTFLACGMQHHKLCLWLEVRDEGDRTITRDFYVVGTGNPIPADAYLHRGTAFHATALGQFVWHVYEGHSHHND
jgi:hypothetical protein